MRAQSNKRKAHRGESSSSFGVQSVACAEVAGGKSLRCGDETLVVHLIEMCMHVYA
jgi:hypothetical protein